MLSWVGTTTKERSKYEVDLDFLLSLTLIALRKTKIECNFGLSECNRVKKCLSTGIPKTVNFPFAPNGKLMVLGVPIFKQNRAEVKIPSNRRIS